jgi:hypothetical protein
MPNEALDLTLFVVPFGVPEEAELVDEVRPVANVINLFLRH